MQCAEEKIMGGRDEISWAELKRMILAHAEQLERTAQLIRELREAGMETDRRMQETDRRMQETDRRMQETDRRFAQLQRELGRLGNRLGDFVEGFVEPAAVRLFRARGLPVREVVRGLEAVDEEGRVIAEVDLLVIDSDTAVAVECKSHAGVAEVREHLRRLEEFKTHFPRFADLKVQGAVAAMHWSREAQRFAYRAGLWVLAQNGESVEVKNDARFTPKIW
ncbi:MAG: hypothetical protein N2441_01680 [Rhodocyclaceae bacterium]|nr:hypothetical protein [Rhodocyclaceae bacterium]